MGFYAVFRQCFSVSVCKCVSAYVFVCYLSRFAFREVQRRRLYREICGKNEGIYREICRGTYRLCTIERHGEAHRVVLNTQSYTYRHTERNTEKLI